MGSVGSSHLQNHPSLPLSFLSRALLEALSQKLTEKWHCMIAAVLGESRTRYPHAFCGSDERCSSHLPIFVAPQSGCFCAKHTCPAVAVDVAHAQGITCNRFILAPRFTSCPFMYLALELIMCFDCLICTPKHPKGASHAFPCSRTLKGPSQWYCKGTPSDLNASTKHTFFHGPRSVAILAESHLHFLQAQEYHVVKHMMMQVVEVIFCY